MSIRDDVLVSIVLKFSAIAMFDKARCLTRRDVLTRKFAANTEVLFTLI